MDLIKVAHIATIVESIHDLLLNQLKSIQHAGYEVIALSAPGEAVSILEANGIRHIPIKISRGIAPLADIRALWQLYRLMRREHFTIVHTHTPKPGLLGQLAANKAGTPIVVNTLHGLYFHDHMPNTQRIFYRSLEKVAARYSDVILSQNREDMRTAVREGICAPEKIKYLGNGIDLRRFDPGRFNAEDIAERRQQLDISANSPIIGFVGRLAARRKGFSDFLTASRFVVERCPEVKFLIVGAPEVGAKDALKLATVNDFRTNDNYLFLGQVPNDQLPLFYALMDVLVLPSLVEGMPRSVMEAAAMGVPAIVTDVKGNREVVEQDRNGLLVPFGDIPLLTEAIIDLITNRRKAQKMGDSGRKIALRRFDERAVFTTVLSEYARLLGIKGERRLS